MATLGNFLQNHKIKKGEPYTHTRIGDKSSDIYGAAYFISVSETKEFHRLYVNEILKKNGKEYLTEAQDKENGGPILVDLDFRYSTEITERQHSEEHINDIIELYVEKIHHLFDLDKNGSVDFDDFFIFADFLEEKEQAKLMTLAQEYLGLQVFPRLELNFPNPFNNSTTLQYRIIEPSFVRLEIYDLAGQKVKRVISKMQNSGSFEVLWNGTNEQGHPVSTGIYLTKLQAGGFTDVRKMLLIR